MKFLEELKETISKGIDFAKNYGPSKKEFFIGLAWLFLLDLLGFADSWAFGLYKEEAGKGFISGEYDPSFGTYYLVLAIKIITVISFIWFEIHRLKVKQQIFEEKKGVKLKDSNFKNYFSTWLGQIKIYISSFYNEFKDFPKFFLDFLGGSFLASAAAGTFVGKAVGEETRDASNGIIVFVILALAPILVLLFFGYAFIFAGKKTLGQIIARPPISFHKLFIELEFFWFTIVVILVINFIFNLYIKTKSNKLGHSFCLGPILLITSFIATAFAGFWLFYILGYIGKISILVENVVTAVIVFPFLTFLFLACDNYRYHRWTDDVN